uniref:Secreted protein n=1 Tax=Mus musculus TaxID=10090 RepID=Q3V2V9_MOUSE|nr:unnamed protein product [Mus musculus]
MLLLACLLLRQASLSCCLLHQCRAPFCCMASSSRWLLALLSLALAASVLRLACIVQPVPSCHPGLDESAVCAPMRVQPHLATHHLAPRLLPARGSCWARAAAVSTWSPENELDLRCCRATVWALLTS